MIPRKSKKLYKMKAEWLLCIMNYISSLGMMYGLSSPDLLITILLGQSGYSRIGLLNMALLFRTRLVLLLKGTHR
jgi:hypothetical protein